MEKNKIEDFVNEIREKHGDFYKEQTIMFFKEAVRLTEEGKDWEAAELCNVILEINKFCKDIDYEFIYIAGFICDLYLDLGKVEAASDLFNYCMQLMHDNNKQDGEDIDRFLDLKLKLIKAKRFTHSN